MAQLKDLIVNGASQLIGDVYTSQIQVSKINAATSAGGTTYGPGTNGQVLLSNGTSTYWGSAAPTITESTVSGWGFTKNTGTVTSVQVQATNPVVSSSSASSSTSLSTTISLADNYGDTKNPYAAKTANYVLAGPTSGSAVPTFRALTATDIPNLSTSYASVTSAVTDISVNSNRQLQKTINGTTTTVTQLAFVPGTGANSAIGGGTGSYTPTASATASFAFGRSANSSAQYAIAIGLQTQATNQYAIAIGGRNSQIITPIGSTTTTNLTAAGVAAIATGIGSVAEGNYSIASGLGSYSKASYSVARGRMSYAYGSSQVVIGSANIIDENNEFALIIGNGTINAPSSGAWSANRSNALTVDWDGNVAITGGLKTNKITAPQESGSTTYTAGVDGQALLTNGSDIYWGTVSSTLKFSNISVNTWVSDTTSVPGFSYKGTANCTGVTSNYVPNVIFDYNELTSGNYAPYADSDTNKVYIYSTTNTTVTIPTIYCV